jgi:hypothetical protein
MEGWDLEGYEKQEKTFYQFEVYNLSFMSQVKSDRKAAQKQLSTQTCALLSCGVRVCRVVSVVSCLTRCLCELHSELADRVVKSGKQKREEEEEECDRVSFGFWEEERAAVTSPSQKRASFRFLFFIFVCRRGTFKLDRRVPTTALPTSSLLCTTSAVCHRILCRTRTHARTQRTQHSFRLGGPATR